MGEIFKVVKMMYAAYRLFLPEVWHKRHKIHMADAKNLT